MACFRATSGSEGLGVSRSRGNGIPPLVATLVLLAIASLAGCASVPVNRASARWMASQHKPGDSWCGDIESRGGITTTKACYWLSTEGDLWRVAVTTCGAGGCAVDHERELLLEGSGDE